MMFNIIKGLVNKYRRKPQLRLTENPVESGNQGEDAANVLAAPSNQSTTESMPLAVEVANSTNVTESISFTQSQFAKIATLNRTQRTKRSKVSNRVRHNDAFENFVNYKYDIKMLEEIISNHESYLASLDKNTRDQIEWRQANYKSIRLTRKTRNVSAIEKTIDAMDNYSYFSNLVTVKNIDDEKLEELIFCMFETRILFTRLYVIQSKISKIPNFLPFRNMKVLVLARNIIEYIPEDFLAKLPVIEILDLSHNRLQNLPEKMLYSASNIKFLNLSGNYCREIPEKFFANCSSIENFEMRDNKISKLHDLTFVDCNQITSIDLSGNQLRSVPAVLFDKCEMLAEVNLKGNPLTAKPSFLALDNLNVLVDDVLEELAKNEAVSKVQTLTVATTEQKIADLVSAEVAAKMEVFEQKFSASLHEVRAKTINVMLDQSGIISERKSSKENAQIELIRKKMESLMQRVTSAENRALTAEAVAREAIEELKKINKLTKNTEEYLFQAIKRINQLGSAYLILNAQVAKFGEYEAICNALNRDEYYGAYKFFNAFTNSLQAKYTEAQIVVSGKFTFNYGKQGLVTNIAVAVANMVPIPGVGMAAGIVQQGIQAVTDAQRVKVANKYITTSGTFDDVQELAHRIAIAILQFNGHIISKAKNDDPIDIAKTCSDSAIDYIINLPKTDTGVSICAEDVAFAVLNGYGMKHRKINDFIQSCIVSFTDNGNLDQRKAHPKHEYRSRDWLSDVMLAYNNDPARLEELMENPALNSLPSNLVDSKPLTFAFSDRSKSSISATHANKADTASLSKFKRR